MLGTIRYKDIRNTTGAVLTASNFPNFTDGEDKQFKEVKRTIAGLEVGTGAGQTRNASGIILDIIASGYDVLMIQIFVVAPLTKIGLQTPYQTVDSLGQGTFPITSQNSLKWFVDLDNSIRVVDLGGAAETRIGAGYIINAYITLGKSDTALDTLNPA